MAFFSLAQGNLSYVELEYYFPRLEHLCVCVCMFMFENNNICMHICKYMLLTIFFILFSLSSLETFAEVLSLVSSGMCELLSSGAEEDLNFGADAVENGLAIVRVVSILIYTVHNVNRESEGQTYAEILQRTVLLQNASTAAFELMGYIFERCIQLRDPCSSFLLSGILVFVEWLACCPDVVAGSDVDEKQTAVRSKFWNLFVSFLNKLLSTGPTSMDDDEDDTCFNNMSRYEEGETENRLALWEDFELRGFLPLLPAQSILEFSRKHSFASDSQKEKKARVKRILAAGKALASVVRVDKKAIVFDSKAKKFIIGVDPQVLDKFTAAYPGPPSPDDMMQENQAMKITSLGVAKPNHQPYVEGEDEDEVIVFKPIVPEKRPDVVDSNRAAYEGVQAGKNAYSGDMKYNGSSFSASFDTVSHQTAFDGLQGPTVSVGNIFPQHLQAVPSHGSKWLAEEAALANSLKGLRFMGNGHVNSDMHQDNSVALPVPIQQSSNVGTGGIYYSHTKGLETLIPSKVDIIASSGAVTKNVTAKPSSAMTQGLRKNPVSRPVRHLGPPPGFSPPPGFGPFPPKQVNEPISGSEFTSENAIMDDYSWLDGYQVPSSMKGSGFNNSINYPSQSNPHLISNSNGLPETINFPFPGKQVPTMQFQVEKQKGWQEYTMFDNLKLNNEEQQQQQQQQHLNVNQNFTPLPEQYQGQSAWTGRYFV